MVPSIWDDLLSAPDGEAPSALGVTADERRRAELRRRDGSRVMRALELGPGAPPADTLTDDERAQLRAEFRDEHRDDEEGSDA